MPRPSPWRFPYHCLRQRRRLPLPALRPPIAAPIACFHRRFWRNYRRNLPVGRRFVAPVASVAVQTSCWLRCASFPAGPASACRSSRTISSARKAMGSGARASGDSDRELLSSPHLALLRHESGRLMHLRGTVRLSMVGEGSLRFQTQQCRLAELRLPRSPTAARGSPARRPRDRSVDSPRHRARDRGRCPRIRDRVDSGIRPCG